MTQKKVGFREEQFKIWEELYNVGLVVESFPEFVKNAFYEKVSKIKRETIKDFDFDKRVEEIVDKKVDAKILAPQENKVA